MKIPSSKGKLGSRKKASSNSDKNYVINHTFKIIIYNDYQKEKR